MQRLLIVAAALALGLSSHVWAESPGPALGGAFPKPATAGAPRAAPDGQARAARGLTGAPVRRYAAALDRLAPDGRGTTRGVNEIRVYALAAPSVVLVLSDGGFGSGALIGADGRIVTNLHVLDGAREVGVIFKPKEEGAVLGRKDVRVAKVVRRDGVTDLAVIQVAEVPAGITPLTVAEGPPIAVGADVHAIGHPTGEAWTYTRGIVSQVRRDYAWAAEDNIPHKATVIQTQTPISPGSSGGPLLDDNLAIVGVNSFTGEGEGLNFAVSAEDVRAVLAMAADRLAEAPKACEVREFGSERILRPRGVRSFLDVDCDGHIDVVATVPDSRRFPITYVSDDDGDGKIDTFLADMDHDGQFDVARYDTDGDGRPDMEGFYRRGEDAPYRYESIRK